MPASPLISDPSPGVRLIALNRPEKKNAFDDAQWDGFADALRTANADEEVAVAVVTGAGGEFSAGVDLSSVVGGPRARTRKKQHTKHESRHHPSRGFSGPSPYWRSRSSSLVISSWTPSSRATASACP